MPEDNATALLIIDVQNAIDAPVWGRRGQMSAEANIARLLSHWRERNLPVFHIRHDSTSANSPYRPGQAGNAFKAEVAPRAGETVIAKRTNSAFIGTDLEERLRQSGISRLVITGVLLENSVGATVRMAGNLGFEVLLPAEAVASTDRTDRNGKTWPAEDVHALALSILDGEYATVVETQDLLDGPV
ncbi:cysteine hydrolase family protein [Denitrobaculum tricleocarpae]|uniref:Cysteine hydrolase n=1 Tax=Denitrobaculum tricleocarpae TaxID=2591009 RepID=A0A545TQX3_9PROT|nr:cysteine hydrolase family protein [Denitrobaculum tricleocarpae]TQV79623.1 cysteine hydrolase [Denitrobaculum tricleocarpae]